MIQKYIKGSKGFTLIELMATIAILALIVVIAVPAVGNIMASSEEKTEAASISMIEKSGSVAHVDGLEHDGPKPESYMVTSLIDNGFLDFDANDALVQNDAYVQRDKEELGNTYEYKMGLEVTDGSMFTWNLLRGSAIITGFSDERPDDLVDIVIPDEYEGLPVTRIAYDSFLSVKPGLSSVILPESIESVGARSFQQSGLSHVYLPEGLQTIDSAAFAYTNLNSVKIPDSVDVIGNSAFLSTGLESVVLGDGVRRLESWSFGRNSIDRVKIPSSVDTIGNNAFSENGLKSVEFEDGVGRLEHYAFSYNDLTELSLPASITVGSAVFQNNKISRLDLAEGLVSLGSDTFLNNELSTIILPESYVSTSWYTFRGNPVETIVFKNPNTTMDDAGANILVQLATGSEYDGRKRVYAHDPSAVKAYVEASDYYDFYPISEYSGE